MLFSSKTSLSRSLQGPSRTSRPCARGGALAGATCSMVRRVKVQKAPAVHSAVVQAVSPKHAFGTDMAAIETALTSSKKAVASEGGMGALNSAALTAFAAQAKLGLHHKYSQGLEAPCTPGAVDCAARHALDATKPMAYYAHNLLNTRNTQPGLQWLQLPQSVSLALLDACIARGWVRPDGQPVQRTQPKQPFRVNLTTYLKMETSAYPFVGYAKDIFGDSDTEMVPDDHAWVNTSELCPLLSAAVLEAHLASFAAGQVLLRCCRQLGVSSAVAQPGVPQFVVSMQSLVLWTSLLVSKYAAVFVQQHVHTARAVLSAVATSAAVNVEQIPSTCSCGGGMGSSSVLTAIGGDDECESSCVAAVELPVQHFAEGDSSSEHSSRIQADAAGSKLSCTTASRKGWWRRVSGAAGHLFGRFSRH